MKRTSDLLDLPDRADSEKRTRYASEQFSFVDLPPEMILLVFAQLSPGCQSTMTETCKTLYNLYYQSKRRIAYTLDLTGDEKDDELRIDILRRKLLLTPALSVRTLDLCIQGSTAGKYSISLSDIAPNATSVTLDFPNCNTFTFNDLRHLSNIRYLHLKRAACNFVNMIHRLPHLETIHFSPEGHHDSLTRNDLLHRKDERALHIIVDDMIRQICPCIGEGLSNGFPNATITINIGCSSAKWYVQAQAPAYPLTLLRILLNNAHYIECHDCSAVPKDPTFYLLLRHVECLRTRRIALRQPPSALLSHLLACGVPEIDIRTSTPLSIIKALRSYIRSNVRNRQTQIIRIFSCNGTLEQTLENGTDFYYLPVRRPIADQ